MLYCTGDNLSWMIKFSIFCAYTAQKLAQLGKKIAQARLPLFPSLLVLFGHLLLFYLDDLSLMGCMNNMLRSLN